MPGRDLRYAMRGLRSHPGFTAVAVISLALGIGVNTAIFSLVDQLLLWRVPAREPNRVMRLSGGYSDTYPFFREYRDRQQVFTALFTSSRAIPVGIRPEGAPAVETGNAGFVSGELFETLGIGTAAGRILTRGDDASPGSGPVAVLSYRYWQKRFSGDLRVLGTKLAINGFPLSIVGIAQAGFHGVDQGTEPDAFLPLTMYPTVVQSVGRAWSTPNMYWLTTYGRLKPGVSASQAQAAMQVLWPQAAEAVNASLVQGGGRRRKFREGQITLAPGSRPPESATKQMSDPLRILAFATGLVLLIACANVANLLLARAAGRRREIAVRLAMGASRGRLLRQLLSESVLLAAIGGALGLAVAWGGVTALGRARILGPDLEFAPSLRLAGFSALLTLATGVIFGLAPAFHATRLTLAESLKDGGGSGARGGRVRMGKALVAAQVALSITLLVGAGLFIRTLRNLKNLDLGYRPENVLTVDIDPSNLGYQGHRLRTFYDQLLERARAIPGVRAAGLTAMTPFGNWALSYSLSVEGYQPKAGERMGALANPVSDGLLTTLGVPLLLGRDFRPTDEPTVTPGGTLLSSIGRASGSSNETPPNASPVCIIDEVMARKYFGGANPVGKHISYEDRYDPKNAVEIVGVVKAAHYSRVKQEDDGLFYMPSWSNGAGPRMLVVRMAGDVAQVTAAIRRETRALNPNAPVLATRTLEQGVNSSLSRERLVAYLAGFFAVLALGLASVGLYGVMAYAVAGRTREVGIRMALGAQRTAVVAMIVRESLVPVALGIGAGLAAALGLSRLVAGMLFGVAPRDPVSLAGASAAMLLVALAAAALPARRASRIEPMDSLRHE